MMSGMITNPTAAVPDDGLTSSAGVPDGSVMRNACSSVEQLGR